jgi:hypothetical protein
MVVPKDTIGYTGAQSNRPYGQLPKININITSAATIFQLHTNTTKIAHPSSKYHFYLKAQRLVFLPQDAKFVLPEVCIFHSNWKFILLDPYKTHFL